MAYSTTRTWSGLNNAGDPLRLGLGWLSVANNVDITSTAALETRRGYVKRLDGSTTDGFSTSDYRRVYVVMGGAIHRVGATMATKPVATLSATARMHWAEVNQLVYFNNGTDSGIINEDDSVLAWRWPAPPAVAVSGGSGSLAAGVYQVACTFLLPDGRETGAGPASAAILPDRSALQITGIPQEPGLTTLVYIAPANSSVFQLYGPAVDTSMVWASPADTLGTDLATAFMDPLPLGTEAIQHWRGQMYASQYLPSANQSVVWASEPLGFHLFNLNSGFFMVPGKALMLAPTSEALIVGTDTGIYAYDGERLDHLAPYGVVPGRPYVLDEDSNKLLIWSTRGVCRAMPFENITQEYMSVAPGAQACAALMRADGHKKFVATLVAGGTAFNQRL